MIQVGLAFRIHLRDSNHDVLNRMCWLRVTHLLLLLGPDSRPKARDKVLHLTYSVHAGG